MRLFSADGEPAVVGVGAQPIGIFAVGQFARGIFCIGQFAVGVVVLGQFAASVWGIGQFGIGIGWFAGMFGLGGRGLSLRLIPGLDPPRVAPPAQPFEAIAAGPAGAEGFVRVDLAKTPHGVQLAIGGHALPVKVTPEVAGALIAAGQSGGPGEVLAHVKREAGVLVCDRLVEIPGQRAPFAPWFQLARLLVLVGIAAAWWYVLNMPTPDLPSGVSDD